MSRVRVSRGLAALARFRQRFSFWLLLAAALHLALFGLLASSRSGAGASPRSAQALRSGEIVGRVLEELRSRDGNPDDVLRLLDRIMNAAARDRTSEEIPGLDSRLSDGEWAKIVEELLTSAAKDGGGAAGDEPSIGRVLDRATAGAGSAAGLKLSRGGKIFSFEGAGGGGTTLYRLSMKEAEEAAALRQSRDGNATRLAASDANWLVADPDGKALELPAEYFFRDCPYERMLALGGDLFGAASGFYDLGPAAGGPIGGKGPDAAAAGTMPTENSGTVAGFRVTFLTRAPATGAGPKRVKEDERPAAAYDDAEIARILDEWMAFPEEEQVRRLFAERLERGDPDDPGLAKLAAEFLYGNLGMVFFRSRGLAGAFDLVEELYYDKLVEGRLVDWWRRHPNTRTGAEMLFGLAAQYEFEGRALERLADVQDEAAAAGRDARSDVYDSKVKAHVLRRIYRDLAAQLPKAGRPTLEAALAAYAAERGKIYAVLERMGGDVAARARFARGRELWDEGRAAEAMALWRTIDPSWRNVPLQKMREMEADRFRPDEIVTRLQASFERAAEAARTRQMARVRRFHVWAGRTATLRASRPGGAR